MNTQDIGLNCRFIETVQPGFFFGDTYEIKWPKQSWTNIREVANELKNNNDSIAVGFKRFIYDPTCGKRYLDKGWIYFSGIVFTAKDCLNGLAKKQCPNIPLTDIAISNIKSNKINRVLYIEDACKLWPLNEEDIVL